MKNTIISALNGLRGLAVLIVVLSHASNAGINIIPFVNLRGNGKIGVYLFFVLSAFLLTLQFLEKGKTGFSLKNMVIYFERRVFRIYPPFLIYLLLALLTTTLSVVVFHSKTSWGIPFRLNITEFFNHLLLQQSKGITWSILVEFKYYFVLPLLAAVLLWLLRFGFIYCLLFITTCIVVILGYYPYETAMEMDEDNSLLPYLPIFLIGSLLAVFYQYISKHFVVSRSCRIVAETSGILSLIAIFIMTPTVFSFFIDSRVDNHYFHDFFIPYSLLWAAVMCACFFGIGWLDKFFSGKMISYFGKISFSLYLWHIVVVYAVKHVFGLHFYSGAMIFLLSVLVAHISWFVVERTTSRLDWISRRL